MNNLNSVTDLKWLPNQPCEIRSKRPCELRSKGSTIIKRFSIDFEDPLWSTMQNLGCVGPSPGPDDVIINGILKPLLKSFAKSRRTFYANPGFVLTTKSNSYPPNFVAEARNAQAEFRHLMRQEFGTGWRTGPLHLVNLHNPDGTSRWTKSTEVLYRLAAIEGMLFIEGRQIHPKQWPTTEGREPTFKPRST